MSVYIDEAEYTKEIIYYLHEIRTYHVNITKYEIGFIEFNTTSGYRQFLSL